MAQNNWGMDTDNLMLDPSLLVSRTADKRATNEFKHYISRSFAELVNSCDSYTEDPTFNFFIGNLSTESVLPYGELERLVKEYELFSPELDEYTSNIKYDEVRELFKERYPPSQMGKLSDVLFDEFVFLFERSWIASRVRKSEDEVTNVPGLRRFIFQRDELDAVANKVPEKYQKKLRTLKRGRKWKWIALGAQVTGAMVSGPVGSAIFSIGLAQNSIALLFDP
ncbi:hypothetical protein ACFQJC_17445 [Haloferax namakaokahaiae]|uniref:Uncharacterized protein n=1 Tax=Haloferax namakaokahaiae TaxID=1748331 RepID=A0ABD5ZK63_9EURY